MRLIVACLLSIFALAAQVRAQVRDDAIERLEATVAKNPDDTAATVDLLQRYAGQADNPDAITARRKLILRLIEHNPESRALRILPATLDAKSDPEGYAEAAQLWRRRVDNPDASAKTVANAAFFFRRAEGSTALALIEAASQKFPGDPELARVRGILDAGTIANSDPASPEVQRARKEIEATMDLRIVAAAAEFLLLEPGRGVEDSFALAELWAKRAGDVNLLITVYQRESNVSLDPREKARYLRQAIQAAATDPQRIRVLPDLANLEFESRNNDAAERAANQLLDLANANPKLGNHDDLIHIGHTVLGRVALDRGDHAEAIVQLSASVQIKKSNGPKMTLAQDLLDAGERAAVLQYLERCRTIWSNDQGRIDHYLKVVNAPGKGDLLAPFTPPGRTPPARRTLAAPVQIAEADAMAWKPVPGAESYVVEWDSRDEKGWASEREGGLVRVIPTRETTAMLDFTGERPIRWRVYAVSARNGAGKTSDWREIQNPLRALPEHAEAEFEAGNVDAAERDARQLLRIAGDHAHASNHGDLAHAANTLLGRVALRRGDLIEAKQRLAASAQVAGSPTLESFGPSMKLAQELLAAGEREAVLQYLEACRMFWKSDRGRLDQFVNLVQHEAAPNLLLPYLNQAPSLVGARAPSFKLKDLAGKQWTLDQLSGRVVILDFWTTWCAPCLEQLPLLEKLSHARDVIVLAINVGEDDPAVRSFLNRNNVRLTVLMAGNDASIVNYRVALYPTLALIDRTGHIVEYHTGALAGAELAQMLPK
jgi:thiol-disulfide isomerase/thioredoxin